MGNCESTEDQDDWWQLDKLDSSADEVQNEQVQEPGLLNLKFTALQQNIGDSGCRSIKYSDQDSVIRNPQDF